jgi:two-component system phosphate regulon response regulator PhoB
MRDSLTLLGDEYEILEADDGRSGLDLIRAVQPDVVLLDISMPELGGVPVCSEIKGDPATADIEIVIVSARTELDFIDATLNAGASDYVIKPFQPRDLVRRVRWVLDKVGAST